MKIVLAVCVLFFIAAVQAETDVKTETKDKRDLFLTPIRQTIVRPALVNRVIQPIVQDVVQPIITQKSFQTVVNPVVMQHHVAQNGMLTRVFKRSAEKEESKDKRDLFLTPIRQTVVRPALINRVVQPVIQDVVQPVITQKTFQTVVNPVVMQHHVAQNGMLTRVFKRSAEKEESKDKRDLFLAPIRQTVFRPAMINRVVQPVIQDVVQPVITQKTFQTIVNPVVMQQQVGQTFGMFKRDSTV